MRVLIARAVIVVAGFVAILSAHAVNMPLILLKSEASEQYYKAAGGDYQTVLSTWRAYFQRSAIAFSEASFSELNKQSQAAVLILPSAVSLSNGEQQILDAHLKKGSSLLGSWALGVRGSQSEWLGYGYLERMFQVKVLADIRSESEERFLLPVGDGPLSTSITAGRRIYLGKIAEPMLRVQAAYSAARFGNWSRESYPAERRLSAISYDEIDGSRRVHLGFPETAWATAGPIWDRYIGETLAWLARRPAVIKAPWPAPAQAVFFMEMDTEDQYDNALVFAGQLEQRQLRSTFYSVSEIASKSKATVLKLHSKGHEIALHGDVHDAFKGLPLDTQQKRFSTQFAQMKQILGDSSKVRGFRAPLEGYDANTEIAMRAAGIGHHVAGVNASEDLLPFFAQENRQTPGIERGLVVIPRGMLDDINYVRMGITDPVKVADVMLAGFHDTAYLRGLGLFSVHSQNYQVGSVLARSVPQLLDKVVQSRGTVWFPVGSEIESWWRARARSELNAKTLANGDLTIALTVHPENKNAPSSQIQGLRLIVLSPSLLLKPDVQIKFNNSAILGTNLVTLDRFRYGLDLPPLNPGSYTVDVKFR